MVYIHLAQGFEEIEAITVADILRRGDIDVKLVSITGEKNVTGAHDIEVLADLTFEDADYNECEMIVLPGGMPGTRYLSEHKGLNEMLKTFSKNDKWLAAICAAPMVLGQLLVLKGRNATCFPGFEEYLVDAKLSEEKVVVDGKIITSKGPGTAAEFALKIVELLKSKDIAENLRKNMII